MSERDLPMDEGGGDGGAGPAPGKRQPSPWQLIGTLGGAAVLAGFAIVLVYQWAHPQILAHRADRLRSAVQQVLGDPDSYRPMYVVDDELRDTLPAGADSADAATVYAGFHEGRLAGFAVPGEKPGYQDVVRLIFGYDPREDRVIGMTVLQSKETPGLGAKITSDSSFIGEFEGIEPPLVGVKEDGDGPHEVDMITGATISSEAVIEIINERLGAVGDALRDGASGVAPASAAGRGETARDGGAGDADAGGSP
ncbi:MAG: FMN-binding protein [Candidatus Palauibacterales bacterium]|nr:FMN-binding protein [Candidatus Palauibacterales bacterium]